MSVTAIKRAEVRHGPHSPASAGQQFKIALLLSGCSSSQYNYHLINKIVPAGTVPYFSKSPVPVLSTRAKVPQSLA